MIRDEMSDVLEAIYAAPLQPEFWRVALERFSKTAGITQAALLDHRSDLSTHRIFAFSGDSLREGGPLYERQFWPFDEWTKRLSRRFESGRVLRGRDIWPESSFRRSIFLNDFLLKYNVCEMACVGTQGGPERFEVLSVYRGTDQPPFSDDQIEALSFLAPHLTIALLTRRRLLTLEDRNRDLEVAFHQAQNAIVLLDASARVVLLNKPAETIFEQRDGLLLKNATLVAQEVRENAELRTLIAQARCRRDNPTVPRGGTLLVSRSARRPLQIVVAPLFASLGDDAAVVILIADLEQELHVPDDLLKELFHLTPAERRLAIGLLGGKPLSEIADDTRLGRETLRTQLKSIFRKTETRRQSELIQLLASLNTTAPRPNRT